MPLLPHPPLLEQVLRTVMRRYRLPATPAACAQRLETSPATALAMAIDQAGSAAQHAHPPDAATQHLFTGSLARLIGDAMRADSGDAAYQAMVLAHHAPPVREAMALQAHAEKDERELRSIVNAVAHPAKFPQCTAGPQREALAQLHAAQASAQWDALAATARRLLAMPQLAGEARLQRDLARLLSGAALARMQHATLLAANPLVQQYQALRDQHGPRSGSPAAVAQGQAAQQRGAAVEALAAQALETLAQRLNAAEGAAGGRTGAWRVVTSMRVPSTLPGSAERAKSEWDAVLLRQAAAPAAATEPAWDVRLLVEAKASIDAATTDFPRLLRGLGLLAQADREAVYTFSTHQGPVLLRGAALGALGTGDAELLGTVLYCCDALAEGAPHLLSAASRMQLLSAPESLAFASACAQGRLADARDLEPVWQRLLESPQWESVLHQYPAMRRVRELVVHVADLSAAVDP
ncbi:3-deoxy-D-arabino-heptulosonate 7-phosphate synthase [Acidovorax sp. LjRoot66]|uniref:3-deoxy-D-arabino-heptulosonate 7-phosphate synthase n=1 Tax=Acidovorax sp. LjRoot66 TaxID=3342334 RepID=UPI003ECEAA62